MNLCILLILIFIIILIVGILIFLHKDKLINTEDIINDKFDENNFFFEINNVLTDKECDELIKTSIDKLERSKVMSINKNNKYEDKIDDVRTSYQTWHNNSKYKNIISKIENLVNSYLKNKITSKQFEKIQVARYNTNQQYKQHYDICDPITSNKDHIETCKQEYKRFNSVRYITVILYLNDGFKGGETYFPQLNKKVSPKKGKALLFFNCNLNKNTKKDGLCDIITKSEHAGLPVLPSENVNEKWIANIWIRTKNI